MNDWMMHPTFSKIPTNENINHNDHVTERSLHKTTAYRFQCPSLRDSHSFLPHRPWRGSTLEFAWRKVIGNTSSLSQITLWTVTVTLTRTQHAQNQKREKAKKIKISNKNWKKKKKLYLYQPHLSSSLFLTIESLDFLSISLIFSPENGKHFH